MMRMPNTKEVILPRASLEHIPERKEIVDNAVDWALRVSYAEIVARIPSQETVEPEYEAPAPEPIPMQSFAEADNIVELKPQTDEGELSPESALMAAYEVYDAEEAA